MTYKRENLHSNHRQRMRERYQKSGMGAFAPHELLELLLFYALPRKNTNALAHQLLSRYGSLEHVLQAPLIELEQQPGIGPYAAVLLNLVGGLDIMLHSPPPAAKIDLSNLAKASSYAYSLVGKEKVEVLYLLALNASGRLIHSFRVAEGTATSVKTHMRELTQKVLQVNSVSVLMVHNHPGGRAEPSQEDENLTRDLFIVLQYLDIHLRDHIIVGSDSIYSFWQEKRMHSIQKSAAVRAFDLGASFFQEPSLEHGDSPCDAPG